MTDSAALKPCGLCGYNTDSPNHFYGCRQGRYEAAKADRVASIILAALHDQDASTYCGASVDMGKLALDAAAKIREVLDA